LEIALAVSDGVLRISITVAKPTHLTAITSTRSITVNLSRSHGIDSVTSQYVLFAAMSGSVQTVVIESVLMTLFAAAAVAGFKSSAWIVVVALAGHGVFDAVHGHVIENAGVPAWWPAWCLAYDVGAAAGLAWLLRHRLVTNEVRP